MRRPTDHATTDVPQITVDAVATVPGTTAVPFLDGFIPRASASAAAVTTAQLDEADKAVNGPAARSTGLDGAGIKIGIISDSFDINGGAAAAEQAGLLPSDGVTVLEDGPPGSTDEGQAMAELIHATAPDAQLYFYSGFYSESDMAAGIAALQAAGCQIIVTDVSYNDEPMFQVAGPIDTAVQAAISAGTSYFSAVGNDGNGAYQANVAPELVNIAGLGQVWAQTFGGATTQSVTIPSEDQTTLSLEWDAPYGAGNTDTITVKILSGNQVIATSTQSGTEPVVTVDFPVSFATKTYSIAILYSSGNGQPSMFKYVLEGGGTVNNTAGGEPTGAAYGQALVPGVNAVGAVNVADTPSEGKSPTPESYSSTGGSELLYASSGAALASPEATSAPDYLAPDGAGTSVFNPFDGTSAAAPVAAAVAALMLQANSTLSTADVTTLLEDSALPAGATSVAGAGLIQANLATAFAATDVISGSPQTAIFGISEACTIQGGSGDHWLVAGSGATVIESQGTDSVQSGTGADTVDLTGAAAAVYGSSTGPTWVRTMDGNDTVVGGTGALTVSGGTGGGIVFGSTSGGNELFAGDRQTIIVSQGTGDLVAGVGNGDLLYASNSGQDTVVGGTGTEFLVGGIGSTAAAGGADVFIAGNGSPVIAPEAAAAVVTFGTGDATMLDGSGAEALQVIDGQAGGNEWIYDFNASKDLLLLSGFGNEEPAAQAAIANQYDTGGNSWVKLPDGTVLAFVGLSHLSASNITFG